MASLQQYTITLLEEFNSLLDSEPALTLFPLPIRIQLQKVTSCCIANGPALAAHPEELLSRLTVRTTAIQKYADYKIHLHPYSTVPLVWRVLYTEAGILKAILQIWNGCRNMGDDDGWDDQEVVRTLDMVLIMTGGIGLAPEHESDSRIHRLLALLPSARQCARAPKRPRLSASVDDLSSLPPLHIPDIKHSIHRQTPSLVAFTKHISQPSPTPFIIPSLASEWPALTTRRWCDIPYLLSQTNQGKRLVPIEIGTAYTDEGWGQRIVTFKEFVEKWLCAKGDKGEVEHDGRGTGYLAQHNLLRQIPSLRADIAIPDYCYISPENPGSQDSESESDPSEPLLNIWLGPANTVSPAHTDPHHNILVQIFGKKYLRLYAPDQSEKLFPKGKGADGVDMSNTSGIPWKWVEGLDDDTELTEEGKEKKRMFQSAEYVECVLEPGEGLFIPRGWWHYVRSLSASCNVSFWWD